jgi:hypothetical protein
MTPKSRKAAQKIHHKDHKDHKDRTEDIRDVLCALRVLCGEFVVSLTVEPFAANIRA